MRKHYTLLLTLLACACCAAPTPKTRIFRAEPLEPEAWYELVYDSVKACADQLGYASDYDYDEVEWFITVPDAMPGLAGLTSFPKRIYLDERFVTNASVVRHEAGHVAIAQGHNSHEDPVFKTCAGAVE